MTDLMEKHEADKIFCWIGNLEIALEDLQRKAGAVLIDIENQSLVRESLLETLMSQRQLWGERPTDAIQKLIDKETI